MASTAAADVPWRALKDEARRLAREMGAAAARDHHSLASNAAALAAVRARGVPPEHREWVWPLLLHAQSRRLSGDAATYSELLQSGGGDGGDVELAQFAAPGGLEQAQELAMERFVHLNPFQERKIKRILVAFTKSKDAFYYCHGMVEICVVLSTFLVEEDAFWAFRLLLEVLLPKYHEESIVDFQTDCLVLQELLSTHDAALCDHLGSMGVTIQLLCTKWFFSFFAESMPFELVCRLYDILLVDICSLRLSSKILFSTSLAVFLYLSATLVEVHDPSVVVEIIYEFCWTTLSDYSVAETFVDLVLFVHDHLDESDVTELRRRFVEQLAQEHEQRKSLQRRLLKKKSSTTTTTSTTGAGGGVGASGDPGSSKPPRKGRIQSIRLLIQWRKHMESTDSSEDDGDSRESSHPSRTAPPASPSPSRRARKSATRTEEEEEEEEEEGEEDEGHKAAGESEEGEVELEIVTTPSEKEVLAKVYQGISKIKRRRSRSTSLRNFSLRGSDGSLGGSFTKRTLSSSSSLSSSAAAPPEIEDEQFEDESKPNPHDMAVDEEDEAVLWGRLQDTRVAADVVAHSMVGVPDEHRSWVWPILLHQTPAPPNLPSTLDFMAGGENELLLDREIVKSIENDISRTRNLAKVQEAPMRRVLVAFASRNRRVGYCQGMNEILVILLQYLDEAEALLALVVLIEGLLPAYHVDSMIGLHTDCAVIDMLLARAHEKQRASRVLLGVGISIFFVLREVLLDAKDAGEVLLAVNEYFANEVAKTTSEMDQFLQFCRVITEQLQPDIVEEFRAVHKDEVMERFAAFEAKKIEMRHQLEAAKAKAKRSAAAPPSPPKTETSGHRYSISSLSGAGRAHSNAKKSGLSSYISKPILGGSGGGGGGSNPSSSSKASNGAAAGCVDDRESRKEVSYRRVDVVDANRTFTEDLLKMEEQLEDLADLFVRGKIDEKEHSCIKAQIVRKWCRGMNSPQSAMVRVRSVKAAFEKDQSGEGRASLGRSSRSSLSGSTSGLGANGAGSAAPNKKGGPVSLYGRMKKVRKSAYAIFKSTFDAMQHAHLCARDPALLEDLALAGVFPDIAWQREQAAPVAKATATASATHLRGKRSKKKKLNTLSFPLHAPSTTIRQALFPTGPGSYPSPTLALQRPPEFERHHYKFHTGSDADDDGAMDNKRRETGWNTSFPAEYARGSLHQDFQQTLAYQEQLNRQRDESLVMPGNARPDFSRGDTGAVAGDRQRRVVGDPEADGGDSIAQSKERLALLKEVAIREGLLAKLTSLVHSAAQRPEFGAERGTELLHLLLQLRDASVHVVQAVANWHASLPSGPSAFCYDGKNYAFKMVSDLNFLAKTKSLGLVLGVNPARMKRNPFMMPAPIPERDFHFVQSLPWSSTERRFSSDPVERVAAAERYLVWCLFHLGDPVVVARSEPAASPARHPNHTESDPAPTWQKRAEKQLQMLSMPLEAPSDRQTHLMDSSWMMKRKGYLPSLSLSPAKTLTDLVDTVHDGGGDAQPTIARRLNATLALQACWNGVVYAASSRELEALGELESPPHHMVTLVAASVLILLSPSDRIPKDMSWPSCRKMLLSGPTLVDRMVHFEVGGVPPFKLKALLPFLQNAHFQPKVLSELSRAAGALCAWVLASLAKAQNQELVTSRSDEDRLDILGELEVEDGFDERQSPAAARLRTMHESAHRPKTPKRVTIGTAEVLFINDNQPVASPASRPASRGGTPLARKPSSVLLRTSPWTFHSVTYFVSFFLERADAALSIKLYEPMSSVESQIFVSEDDLAQDFGESALEAFQSRDYRSLCDLILSRLDGMLTSARDSGRDTQQLTGRPHGPADDDSVGEPDPDLLPRPSVRAASAAAIDLLEMQGDGSDDVGDEDATARERLALVDDDEEELVGESSGSVVEESVLRIQCAARQRMARDRVAHARFEHERTRDASAVKIQSAARLKLAKKEVARMRAEGRQDTGIPAHDLMFRGGANGAAPADDGGDLAEQEEEDDDAASEAGGVDEREAAAPLIGHFGAEVAVHEGGLVVARAGDSGRPETVMSYASDQFEDDDFEAEDDDG
ncbi:hypothetical protein PybrP1_001709 [[Pythium] brassicae (nom. inval.)]|nr:hypothetical protein PybrP1_001709 [[Pythium] brassicae (nom. inval.)]